MSKRRNPTVEFYASLQKAFDHFNHRLFKNQLPPCLITLRSSSMHFGYHHKDRFVNTKGERLDELGLHPGFFTLRPVEEVLSTLVHEMVHHWQHRAGKSSKSTPHNREWAQKMREIGLEPSSTGLPNGKDTGQRVSHYIRPDGPFVRACQELLDAGFRLQWFDRHVPRVSVTFEERQEALEQAGVHVEVSVPPAQELEELPSGAGLLEPPPPPKTTDRVRYQCSGCGVKAWAGTNIALLCGTCSELMLKAV